MGVRFPLGTPIKIVLRSFSFSLSLINFQNLIYCYIMCCFDIALNFMAKIFKKGNIIIISILLVSVGGVYFLSSSKNKGVKLPFDIKKSTTVKIKRGNLVKELKLGGEIDSQNFAVLTFQTYGMLSWLGVKEGDTVKKYQAVASLDKNDLTKRFQKELNDYMTTRWNFEDTADQYKITKDKYLVTPEIQRILDRSQFTLNNSVLDLEIADIALKYATLISPINGVVTKVSYPASGINVTPLNFSITVVDPEGIYFKSEADEEDVTFLTVGQKAKVSLNSYPEDLIDSEIINIAFTPIEGQSSTVYRVKFSLFSDNIYSKYWIGMNGDASVKLDEKIDVLYVPSDSVFDIDNEKYVFVKRDNKTLKTKITTGMETDENVEIIDGISEGQTLVY